MKNECLSLEQSILREWKRLKTPPKRVIMALSGGRDSMVMAAILLKWQRALQIELEVVHVHHGRAKTTLQNQYRNRAQKFVKNWAQSNTLKFHTNTHTPESELRSELEWREWREQWIKPLLTEGVALAVGHHQDDLLETRMLRLIRGCGPQGLGSMASYAKGRWRPLLKISSVQVARYAQLQKLKFIEDPSNTSLEPMRNWLRHEWLPLLEKKSPGTLKSLAQSCENLSTGLPTVSVGPYLGLRRELFEPANASEKSEIVARFLNALGLKGYAKSHIDELLKRMCVTPPTSMLKEIHFAMLGHRFSISRDFVWASRV